MNDFRENLSPRPAQVGAIGSLLLGVASFALFVVGMPAIILGLASLRRLNASAGSADSLSFRCSRGSAVAGMLLGGTATVLFIVGLVAQILTPATEKSRRAECANNLRAIGAAVEAYHDINDHSYPKAVMNVRGGELIPPERRLSWLVEMLPYLEGPAPEGGTRGRTAIERRAQELNALYERFDARKPWNVEPNASAAETALRQYVCPSHPRREEYERPGLNFYPGIAGVGADAPLLPLDDRRAGALGYNRQLQVDWKRKDADPTAAGRSNVMLCAETMRANGPWAAGGAPTLRSLIPAEAPYIGYDRPFGGMHPGGANLLMLDGSVTFFTERGSARVLELKATLLGPGP